MFLRKSSGTNANCQYLSVDYRFFVSSKQIIKFYRIVLIGLMLSFSLYATAQITVVEFDIKSGTLKAGEKLPFDEPFLIKGQLDEEHIKEIRFSYRIKNQPKFSYALPGAGSMTIKQAPKYGTLVLESDNIVYYPDQSFVDQDQFELENAGASSQCEIRLNNIDKTLEIHDPTGTVGSGPFVNKRNIYEKWYYFPEESEIDALGFTFPEFRRSIIRNEEFLIPVGALHPNLAYEFRFRLIYGHGIPDSEIIATNQELYTILRNSVAGELNSDYTSKSAYETTINNYYDVAISKMCATINKKLNSEVKGRLVSLSLNSEFDCSVIRTSPEIRDIKNQLIKLNVSRYVAERNIKYRVKDLLTPKTALLDPSDGYYNTLKRVLDNVGGPRATYSIAAGSRSDWNSSFFPESARIQNPLTLANVSSFITDPILFKKFITGEKKIQPDGSIVDSSEYDLYTFKLLQSCLNKLLEPTFEQVHNRQGRTSNFLVDGSHEDFQNAINSLVFELEDNLETIGKNDEADEIISSLLYKTNALLYSSFNEDISTILNEVIQEIIDRPDEQLNASSKRIWEDSLINSESSLLMKELAVLFTDGLTDQTSFDNNLELIFLGKKKLQDDGSIADASAPDIASIELIIAFFEKLERLRDKRNFRIFRNTSVKFDEIGTVLRTLKSEFQKTNFQRPLVNQLKASLFDDTKALFYSNLKSTSSSQWYERAFTYRNRLRGRPLVTNSGYTDINPRIVLEFFRKYLEEKPEVIEDVLRRKKRLQKNDGADTDFITGQNNDDLSSIQIFENFFNYLPLLKRPLEDGGQVPVFTQMDETFTEITLLLNRLQDIYKITDRTAGSEQAFKTILDKLLKPSSAKLYAFNKKSIGLSLSQISSSQLELSEYTKSWWINQPMHPEIEAIKSITYNAVSKIVADGLANHSYLEDILNGLAKIDGGNVVNSTEVDHHSILLLSSFFKSILSTAFLDNNNSAVFIEERDLITGIIKNLDQILVELNVIKELTKIIEDGKKDFPNYFTDVAIEKHSYVTDQPFVDIESENNSYVGLDFGIAYTPALRVAMLYQGVNIYFKPVNKAIPLSSFRNWDRVWKSLSVFVGVTQNIFKNDEVNLVNLTSVGNLMIGTGCRINNVMRINVGGVIFYQTNERPLAATKKLLKVTPTVSVSWDFNVSAAVRTLITSGTN